MTGYLINHKGDTYELPTLFSWNVVNGFGTPCDAYEVCFVYKEDMSKVLSDAVRFRGVYDGETVFCGIVDEYEISINSSGCSVSISGRGLGGLLLDNEAEATEYMVCTLEDILNNHVRPYGINSINADVYGSANSYKITSGRSEWAALYEFSRYVCNVTPYFTRDGKLIISKNDGDKLLVDDKSGAFDLKFKEKRYERISEALVKNNTQNVSVKVQNDKFLQKGGMCRRVINVPRNTGYDAMRYTGAYQIKCAEEESVVLEFSVPKLFAAYPNDCVTIKLEKLGIYGEFRVKEASVWADGISCGTRIKLISK